MIEDKEPDARPKPTSRVLLDLGHELNTEVRSASADLRLSMQQVLRLSIERGLPILRRQLEAPVEVPA